MKKVTVTFSLIIFAITIYSIERKYFWVESFNQASDSSIPKSWKGRTSLAKKYYRTAIHKKRKKDKYLKVDNLNSDMFIIKKLNIDIVKYPYLNWKWRVRKLPVGGNESIKNKADNGASITVVLVASKWKPKSIKYSWSTTLKKGTVTKSPYCIWPAKCDIVVMRSGKKLKNKWVYEKRNVAEDYKKFYNDFGVKSYKIEALVIMSDSDNTKSVSAADYDNIYFSAK